MDRSVDFEVPPARRVTVALTADRRGPLIVPPAVAATELPRDGIGWCAWTAGVEGGSQREAVVRSLITLQLLT